MRPPPVPQQEGEGSAPPITPTTPTSLITPTTHSGQQVMQPGDYVIVSLVDISSTV